MAMNEKLVQPLVLTVGASTNAALPDNLLSERLGRVCTLQSNGYVVLDAGAAMTIDTAALLATNAGAASVTWQVQGFTTLANAQNATSPVGGTGNVSAWASADAGRRLHRQGIAFFGPVTARYWRLTCSAALNIGRLVLGAAFTAADTMDIGFSHRVVDLGTLRRSSNALDDPTIRGKVLEFSWTWGWMTETEARGAMMDVLAYAGTTRNILACLNPDAPDLHNVIAYGKIVEEVEPTNVAAAANGAAFNAYEAKLRLQSRLLLNL